MAGTSVISICNLALARLGQGQTITSLTEDSQAAQFCSSFYEQARDEALVEYPWPFALRRVTLAVVETAPNDDWAFSYRRPTGCLTIRRVLSGLSRNARPLTFEPGGDDSGGLIYTDYDAAAMEYIARVENPGLYPPKFVHALAWRLAADLAGPLQRSPAFESTAMQNYRMALSEARMHAANEGVPDPEGDGTFIDARTGGVTGTGEDWTAYPGGIRIS
jgi:hypothetical protein